MSNGLKISFTRHQLTVEGRNVIAGIGRRGNITYIYGDVPEPGVWVDVTDSVTGLEKLNLTWDYLNQGNTSGAKSGSNYDKGITAEIELSGESFTYAWNWMMATYEGYLNSVDVRIEDTLCGKRFRLFEIKADNISYKPKDKCQLAVRLREQDLSWHCIHKTFIWDDHLKWFNEDGKSTKAHPTFLTCIEPRPKLIASVRMAAMFIANRGNLVGLLLNKDIKDDVRMILNLNRWVPAPLVRDYIENVARKCGLKMDTIFNRVGSLEHNLCLFHPSNGAAYEDNDGDSEVAPDTRYLFENRDNITLPELLDKLKVPFNAEWYITPNNTIVFKPIEELRQYSPIYDFTTGDYEMEDLEYTFDGQKKAAYGRYQYSVDGSDLGSQEVSNLYNDIVDYDGPASNPMLEGEKNKTIEFAPTAFIRDGRSVDYIQAVIREGGLVAQIIGGITSLGIGAIGIGKARKKLLKHFANPDSFYNGAIRMVGSEQTITPRLIYWDGKYLNKAKAVATKTIEPNTYFNPSKKPYSEVNKIAHNNHEHYVFNYPAYFDSKFKGNMYDRFHDRMDNPLLNLESNQQFSFSTTLCCGMMDLLGLWENGFVKIGYLLLIEKREGYSVYGRIEHIDVDYSVYKIKIKGKVIRK